jgi:hypothetical protein
VVGAGVDAEVDFLDGLVDEANSGGAMAALVVFCVLEFSLGLFEGGERFFHLGLIGAGGLGEDTRSGEDGGEDDDREEFGVHRISLDAGLQVVDTKMGGFPALFFKLCLRPFLFSVKLRCHQKREPLKKCGHLSYLERGLACAR